MTRKGGHTLRSGGQDVNIHDAKTRLSQLIERVEAGEETARLLSSPFQPRAQRRWSVTLEVMPRALPILALLLAAAIVPTGAPFAAAQDPPVWTTQLASIVDQEM